MNQPIVRTNIETAHPNNADSFVLCPKCKKEVGLRKAYLDKYQNNMQVHYNCLSKERLQEINNAW